MEQERSKGLLPEIRGDEVSAASATLPNASSLQPHTLSAETNSVQHGRVVVTFKLASYKRGKIIHWHWLAIHAQKV